MFHLSYKLSYKFQNKDHRDHTYKTEIDQKINTETTTITRNGVVTLKKSKITPLRYIVTNLPSIVDQRELGTCVINAFFYCVSRQTNRGVNLSRLFLYALCG